MKSEEGRKGKQKQKEKKADETESRE